MSQSILQKNLNWQLLRVAINAKHGLMNIAEKYHLTVMQMYAICLLEADSSIPMISLTNMLHCDASNVTGIVDRLFHQKYIKREENPHDRREKMIALTPKGVKLSEKIAQSLTAYEPDTLAQLTQKEKQDFLILLSKTSLASQN